MSEMTESDPGRLQRVVQAKVESLQQDYRQNRSSAVAALAQLRRGVGKAIGADFSLIELTVAELYQADEKIYQEPSYAEQAAYAAITLYAVHQQSQRNDNMHQEGYSFGQSAGTLCSWSTDEKTVRRRFESFSAAPSFERTLHYARSLIQQFRSEKIPLDYGQFAKDLFWLQISPAAANRVRRRWGLDFYQTVKDGKKDKQGAGLDEAKIISNRSAANN